ncbi:CPBP family intramembrane metalloprotease [Actinotalea sp. C106]|uniref:CPBP family intramembrane metalloprotease n=1 Tax=Actinotalea sp. C106 TaxID=2908644 RepID=UPI002029640B|nr:CPBP family intramembrane metalloprotease [Actinotalea sp. C106]
MPATTTSTDPATQTPLAPRWALLPAAGVSASAVLLFGVHLRPHGYVVLVLSLGLAYLVHRPLAKDLLLIALGISIVSTTSMEADLEWGRFFAIGTALTLAVLVPFLVDRFVYRRRAIRFPWRTGQKWPTVEKWYLLAVPLLGWAILPTYFITSGAYQNWPEITDSSVLMRFFVGVNAVGTWDELFFICLCFALLLRHFPAWQANLLQAAIFVSFLWELGYREWGPALTIPFALLQGLIFTRTRSLTLVLIVHLLFDAIVFMAIVHAHRPEMFSIFIY